MKKNIQVAVLFGELYLDGTGDYRFLAPKRILVGETDEKSLRFYDYLSQEVYYHSDYAMANDIEESFYLAEKLDALQERYKTDDLYALAQKYLGDVRKKVYYFDATQSQVLSMKNIPKFFENSETQVKYGFVQDDQNKFDDNEERIILEAECDRKIPNIQEAYKEITKYVLCQDEQVKRLLTAIYKNLYFDSEEMKSNILIYGPTGVGKTAILKRIAKILDVPIVIEDATRFTVSGYQGSDVEEALVNLYYAADKDIEAAQYGILAFEEIDKKATTKDMSAITTEGAIHRMLKIVEGATINIEISPHVTIPFDTSRLTVIFSGAFSKMSEKINKPKTQIGFAFELKELDENSFSGKYTPQDFIQYGFSPEFIGRINCYVPLNALTIGDIKHILRDSESSPLKAYQGTFEKIKLSVSMQNRLIDLIAEKAFRMNTGARGLQLIVNEMFEKILFEVFADNIDTGTLILQNEILEDNSNGYQFTKKSSECC